jgi:hypothetical protein
MERLLFAAITMIGLNGCLSGCSMLGNKNMFPDELTQLVQVTAEQIADQGVIDQFATDIKGNVQDPGVESYVSIKLAAGVRMVGVNGDIDVTTGGTGTVLPAGTRETLIKQLDGPLSDDQRTAILEILGWNRKQPAVATPPNP